MGISPHLLHFFPTGDNFPDSLIASLDEASFSTRVQLLKGRICFRKSKFFPSRLVLSWEGRRNEIGRKVLPDDVTSQLEAILPTKKRFRMKTTFFCQSAVFVSCLYFIFIHTKPKKQLRNAWPVVLNISIKG